MIDTSEFRNGLVIEVDNEIYKVLWFQHHKPGKGGAIMRTKLQNIRSGAIIERTFKSGEKFREIEVERRKKQYIYNDTENYYFMDMVTFDQIHLKKEQLGDAVKYLKENMEIEAQYINNEFFGIELPVSVELKVVHTEPGIKGDTVTNVMKPAILETGAEVNVPLFIEVGDTVKIDTRTGEYIERV